MRFRELRDPLERHLKSGERSCRDDAANWTTLLWVGKMQEKHGNWLEWSMSAEAVLIYIQTIAIRCCCLWGVQFVADMISRNEPNTHLWAYAARPSACERPVSLWWLNCFTWLVRLWRAASRRAGLSPRLVACHVAIRRRPLSREERIPWWREGSRKAIGKLTNCHVNKHTGKELETFLWSQLCNFPALFCFYVIYALRYYCNLLFTSKCDRRMNNSTKGEGELWL